MIKDGQTLTENSADEDLGYPESSSGRDGQPWFDRV